MALHQLRKVNATRVYIVYCWFAEEYLQFHTCIHFGNPFKQKRPQSLMALVLLNFDNVERLVYLLTQLSESQICLFISSSIHCNVIHGQIHRHFITGCFVTRVRKCSLYCPILIDYLHRSVSNVCRFSTVAYETFISASTSLSLCSQESNDLTVGEEQAILTHAKIVL